MPTLKDTVDMDSFGGKHAEFAKNYMEEEFRKGERLFDALIGELKKKRSGRREGERSN